MLKSISEYSMRLIRLLLCWLLLYMQLINGMPKLIAADEQSSAKAKLDQAEESYYNGNPQQSITLTRQCLTDSLLSMDDRIRAHKILARSYLNSGRIRISKRNPAVVTETRPGLSTYS